MGPVLKSVCDSKPVHKLTDFVAIGRFEVDLEGWTKCYKEGHCNKADIVHLQLLSLMVIKAVGLKMNVVQVDQVVQVKNELLFDHGLNLLNRRTRAVEELTVQRGKSLTLCSLRKVISMKVVQAARQFFKYSKTGLIAFTEGTL